MLSDLCSSTPKTSVSLSVPVSLSPSLPLSVLCSVCTGWLFVYLRTDRLRFDQVRAPGATHRWPSSLVVCSHARIQTHARTHTLSTLTYTHSCAHHRGRARRCEIDGERKRERAEALMCSTFSVFVFQTAAIITNRNVKGEAQKRSDDG